MTPETAAIVLNIEPNAPIEEIHAAFRRRARLLHPDRLTGSPQSEIDEATREFARANEALVVLIHRAKAQPHFKSNPSGPSSPPPRAPQPPREEPRTTYHAPSAAPSQPDAVQSPRGRVSPGREQAGRVVLGSVVGLLGLFVVVAAALSIAPPPGQSNPIESDPPAAVVEEQAPAATPSPSIASMPTTYSNAGYMDAGEGLAWKWTETTSCKSPDAIATQFNGQSSRCWTMTVQAHTPCEGSVQATIDTLDASGQGLGKIDGVILGAQFGNTYRFEFDTVNLAAKSARLSSLSCF